MGILEGCKRVERFREAPLRAGLPTDILNRIHTLLQMPYNRFIFLRPGSATSIIRAMADSHVDIGTLSESQQLALGTYTSVTNQEPAQAISLLQRSEWNVQVRHAELATIPRQSSFANITLDRCRQVLRRGSPGSSCRSSSCSPIFILSATARTTNREPGGLAR